MKMILSGLRTFVAAAVLAGCATSPMGRKQLILVPDGQMDSMGVQAFSQMKAQQPIDRGKAVNAYVRCVALAVAEAAKGQTSRTAWEVVVFRDPTANAFALPGGKIGVHTGILPVASTPGQLAAVLGHEVGHVIARHGNERVSQGFVTQYGIAALGEAISGKGAQGGNQGLAVGLLGLGAQFGVLLPFSRKHESEADLIGLGLMARAGFDPREAVALWKNMAKSGGGQPPEFMSTHPSHETRISDIEANLPPAIADYERAKAGGKHPACKALKG